MVFRIRNHARCLVCLFLSCCLSVALGQSFPSAASIQQRLESFTRDVLAVPATQQLYTAALQSGQTSTPLDGQAVASSLASKVSSRLVSRRGIANSLRSRARGAFDSGQTTSSLTECCRLSSSSVQFDERFNGTVNLDNGCDRISATASSSRLTISATITAEAKSQLSNIPEVKYQYFGSEQGYTTVYPGLNISTSDCSSFDPRYRPWYAAAAAPTPRDLVIIVDVSGSMEITVSGSRGRSRLDLAKEAIDSILTTLSDSDRITIVPFETNVKPFAENSNVSCFATQLGEVTPYSIRQLKYHVNQLSAGGLTNYGRAFTAAFARFSATPARLDVRQRVIMFLTDGSPSDTEATILSAQRSGAADFNYGVTVLTYALGTNVGGDLLRRMARQTYGGGFSLPSGSAIGQFQQISDFNNLRASLSRYYSFFASESTASSTIITMPYYDAFGLGVILTVAAPVYSGTLPNIVLRGVVGVDITASDLFGDISYFSDAEHQYAFMINNDGEAVLHPLLAQPVDISNDPLFQDITLLEVDAEFRSNVYWQMRNRTTGTATFRATRFTTSGNSLFEGSQKIQVNSSYYWTPIVGTDFTLCVVLVDEMSNEVTPIFTQAAPAASTLYHRVDLGVARGRRCNQFGRLAVGDASAVKFSPEAFQSPSQYLNVPETSSTVNTYIRYLDGSASSSVYFKDTVRNSVRLTSTLDGLWQRAESRQYSRSVVWRYIGSIDGVFRILPGTQLPTAYDHLRRDWFVRSLNNPGQMTLSPPYLDAFGSGYVVTLSNTIMQSDAGSIESVGAVMGVDFTMGFLGLALQQAYPQCASTYRCVLMDKAGFLIYHPDFVSTAGSPEYVHLGRKEPYALRALVNQGIAKKISCSRFDTLQRHVTYDISIPRNTATGSTRCSVTLNYKFEVIPGTPVIVGFLSTTICSAPSTFTCDCPMENGLGICNTPNSNLCECPCTTALDYSACTNSFTAASTMLNVCPSEVAGLPVVPRRPDAVNSLENCFNGRCSNVTSAGDCRATQGCAWCTRNSQDIELAQSFCTTDCQCFGGSLGQENPAGNCAALRPNPTEDPTTTSGSSSFPVAAVAVPVAVVFIVIVLLLIYYKGKRAGASSQGVTVAASSSSSNIAAVGYAPAPTHDRRPSAPTDPGPAKPQPPSDFSVTAPPDYNAAVHIGGGSAPYPTSSTAPYPSSTAPYPSSTPYPPTNPSYPPYPH